MEDDKDDTDPVATACAIVIPTVFVAVVLTIMWRNGTLARAFEKAMQGASEALKAGEEAVNNNNNNNNTSNTNNNAPQPDVEALQREIEALKGEKARAEARALQREIEALKEEKARAEAIALRVGAPGTRTGAAQHYPMV